jgi:hypothetical protein
MGRVWLVPDSPALEESAGFIWGGKWLIWDNMHFSYRSELPARRALFD